MDEALGIASPIVIFLLISNHNDKTLWNSNGDFNKKEKSRWIYYNRQLKFLEFVGLMEGSREFLDFQLGQFI